MYSMRKRNCFPLPSTESTTPIKIFACISITTSVVKVVKDEYSLFRYQFHCWRISLECTHIFLRRIKQFKKKKLMRKKKRQMIPKQNELSMQVHNAFRRMKIGTDIFLRLGIGNLLSYTLPTWQ